MLSLDTICAHALTKSRPSVSRIQRTAIAMLFSLILPVSTIPTRRILIFCRPLPTGWKQRKFIFRVVDLPNCRLSFSYKRGITLTGLLFLHRITDNRMAGTPLKNLRMFERLCGVNALRNVMLVTTMWSEIDDMTALSYEKELQTTYWNAMVSAGSRISRFDYSHESAWAIVDHLNGTPLPVQLQVELVDEGKPLAHTSAGTTLFQWFENLISHLRDLVIKLEARLRGRTGYGPNLAKETAEAKSQLQEVTNQRNRLTHLSEPQPEPTPPQLRFGLHRSGSSWSLTRIPSGADDNQLPEPHYSGKLVATISALRHARDVANATTCSPLKGAVGLALTIAETVEVYSHV
jgi:hypothetical protein